MKIYLIAALLLLCFSSGFWGCQQEDLGVLDSITDTAQAGPITEMVANINDTAWSAIATEATLSPGKFSLTGMSENGQEITLDVPSNVSGTFLLDALATSIAKYYPDSLPNTIPYSSNSRKTTGGIINIETLDTIKGLMSGSFGFISQRPTPSTTVKNITEGEFKNISFTNTSSRTPFTTLKNDFKWVPASAVAAVAGATITITASSASKDTTIILTMPVNVVASSKPFNLAPTGLYKDSVQEQTPKSGIITLSVDTSTATKTKYRISPQLTILSNNGSIIQGTFSFVATFVKSKTTIATRFRSGSFYLKYK